MSINYADALSPFENKGAVGMPELFDTDDAVKEKCAILAEWIQNAKHCLVITGAGVSTSAGIADFRGPTGVWTLEKEGKPANSVDFSHASPTFTHHALRLLEEHGQIDWLVSQNVDGLHPKSGFPLNKMAELHGNVFAEQCQKCKRRYYRDFPVGSFCLRPTGRMCEGTAKGRPCRGHLVDMTLDWEDDLPEPDFSTSQKWAECSDLTLCLGTSLQIIPVGDFPLKTKRRGGRTVTVNLQKTKHESKIDLTIHAKVDVVMRRVLELLDVKVPDPKEVKNCIVWESSHPPVDPASLLKEKNSMKRRSHEPKNGRVKGVKREKRETVVDKVVDKVEEKEVGAVKEVEDHDLVKDVKERTDVVKNEDVLSGISLPDGVNDVSQGENVRVPGLDESCGSMKEVSDLITERSMQDSEERLESGVEETET